jgi:O-antigen ligase
MNNILYSRDRWLFISVLSILFLVAIIFSAYNYIVSFVILAFLFIVVLFFLKPLSGLYLISLFLPITGLAVNYKGFELPFIDLLSVVVLISFVVRHVYLYFFSDKKEGLKFPGGIYFLLFFIFTLISGLLSDGIITHLWYSCRWILFFYLAFVVMPFNLIKDTKILHRVIIFISLGASVVALMSLVSLFLQDWSDTFSRVTPLPIFGQWIFGENYNLLSEFLSMSAFLILSLKYWVKDLRVNRFLNLLSAFFILLVFLTFSRTSWITVSLQLILYFLIYNFVIKRNKVNVKEILLVLFLMFVMILPFSVKMISLQEANYSSTENRTLLTQIAWEAFLEKPFLGWGSGSFVSLVEDNVRFVAKYGDPLDSHGFGQKVLAENGILGTIAFILFVVVIFNRIYSGVVNNREDYKLLLPLFISSFGVFFYQIFNTSYYKGRVWLPIAIALIAVNLISNKNKK